MTALSAILISLSACGGDPARTGADPVTTGTADWPTILAEAEGQTLNWYMYGGDEALNTFVTGYVADQLSAAGITLNQVRITDTAEAVNKVLGEKQAGRRTGGSVDAIWINGENFATGVQADLWACGWDRMLPNSRYVDFTDPAVSHDFGVPVNGCEAVWQQANSALVYDSAHLSADDVASVPALLTWAQAHPGRFTYPAPPDFTGSMAVRTILYDTIGGPSALPATFDERTYLPAAERLWPRLNAVEPNLWQEGTTYPQSQVAVEKLFADGEISAYFTYGPGTIADQVTQGVYPSTTRVAVLDGGNIANRSFIAVPANAAHRAAAMVLANVLQDPRTQLTLYQATGAHPGIDLTETGSEIQKQFEAVPRHPSLPALAELTSRTQPELASAYLSRIEKDWTTEVLQR